MTVYNERNDKLLSDIQAVLEKHQNQIKEANRLTDLITGDKNRRGLYQRILDEKAKAKEVLAEQELLRPLLVNTAVESQLILKRQRQMQKRIDELKNANVATGKSGKTVEQGR